MMARKQTVIFSFSQFGELGAVSRVIVTSANLSKERKTKYMWKKSSID